MTRKIGLALGCFALLTTFATAAMADAITFTYAVISGSVATKANLTGSPSLTAGPASGLVIVKDTKTALSLVLPVGSSGEILSDNNIGYAAGPSLLIATYAGSAATQVQVLSSFCGGACVSGTNNLGTYTAFKNEGGGFGGVFQLSFISPAILAFFGDSTDIISPNGATSFTTVHNKYTSGGTTDAAQLGSGSITVQTTPVPEPSTLVLLGGGILGVARLVRKSSK
jgi:hypothetical protein